MSPRFRVPARRKKNGRSVLAPAATWVLAGAATAYLAWCLFFPASSGKVGRAVSDALLGALGGSAYLLPPLLAYGLALVLTASKLAGVLPWTAGTVLILASTSALLAALGSWSGSAWGGAAGSALWHALRGSLGPGGAALVAAAAGLVGGQTLFEIPWKQWLRRSIGFVMEDWTTWRRARQELKESLRSAAARPPAALTLAPEPASAMAGEAAIVLPAIVKQTPARAPAKPAKAPESRSAGTGQLPPLDLLQPRSASAATGPEEAEVRAAVENLDRTLASFGIQARVSGISPGPVITRYEVSPSPGVTVSSIVARANDIALAMKARGIRMIAPIPGKAAIGIELPNQKPATVTLRELLESRAFERARSPLGFSLGLSSDGTPAAADLQTLPHLLVAGATNSGKSVLVHSLIMSLLFRCRPEEVKLLLIDPKRIELSLYDGIPHLYDPKTPCDQVGVITHSKDAARSLKALILIMESRYEKFQAYKVRDIETFNKQAAKDGRPPEFYIVVVIDELADLMIIARDVVEDSIQRLAQMARAVGIHLVLATQRPSVDVITGVIKANLPARAALRVASKVDSKVILDQNGAEALVGKGDMLWMAPGQEPARIQGAYVSTEEIGRAVDFLRQQGKPDYPTLATMASVGEEDLHKFGVEPQEFVQALALVQERRRVSQDLLKSQFGSSARATNILSLLEVKGFIHKPEGTNRWEIHFDRIEDYLKTRKPA